MSTDQEQVHRDWRMPDELWARLQQLLPPRKPHPLGCHRPRVDDRQVCNDLACLHLACAYITYRQAGLLG